MRGSLFAVSGLLVAACLAGPAWSAALEPGVEAVSHRTSHATGGERIRIVLGTPAAKQYSTVEQPVRGPAARVLKHAFPHLVLSRALSRAAAVYARFLPHDARRQPPIAFLEFLIHWAGCPDPSAAATVFYTTGDDTGEVVRAVRHLLAQRDLKDVSHIGVAKVPGDGRPYRWRWGILVVHRSITLPRFPSRAAPGTTLPLQFRLTGDLRRPEVWILPPGGRPKKIRAGRSSRDGSFAVAAIPLGSTPGKLWVEIVGHGRLGPEVAANFPVFVGASWPRAWTGSAPPDESWVHTARQAETLMERLVNADRKRFGLPPLAADPALMQIARAHSRDMAAHGYFGHTSPSKGGLAQRLSGAGYPATWCGENVAEADSIAGAEADLMRSPGHRANILAVEATHLGIGIVERPAGRGLHWLITQEFARPASAQSPAGFRKAVRRSIDLGRAERGLGSIPVSDVLDRIAEEMARRVASGRLSEDGCMRAVEARVKAAGIPFRRLEVVTFRVPVPEGLRFPAVLFDRRVEGIGVGTSRPPANPLTVVVLIVTLNAP